MNYFELYEIPETLQVDKVRLKGKFLELSRRYHPDYFTQAPKEQRLEALEKSAEVNKGFQVLTDQDRLIGYVLKQKGLLEEEDKPSLEPSFLMEVMEINEALADADSDEEKAVVVARINEFENEINESIRPLIESYPAVDDPEKVLLQIRSAYYRKKYLLRLKEQLGGML